MLWSASSWRGTHGQFLRGIETPVHLSGGGGVRRGRNDAAMSENTDRSNPKPPSVDRLSLLWHRINDHKMVQWSVAYIALAYGVQNGVELTSDAFEWPHAVVRASMLLLVLGLPVVMTLA